MSPDEHAVGISFVLRDVVLEPLDHARNVAASVVPILSRMPLHGHGNHAVLDCPPPDIVVKRVTFPDLLFNFVAATTRHVNQNSAVVAAFFGTEDVDKVFRI